MAFLIRVLGIFAKVDLSVTLYVFSHFVFFVDYVKDVSQVDQRRCGDKDDLEDPETNVGDREGVVVADIFTTGLLGVTNHIGLFVTPNLQEPQRGLSDNLLHTNSHGVYCMFHSKPFN